MKPEVIFQVFVMAIAAFAAWKAYRPRLAQVSSEASHDAIENLQASISALEKRLEIQAVEHASELAARDLQIAELKIEIDLIRSTVGPAAEKRLIEHIDAVGDRIVQAIKPAA